MKYAVGDFVIIKGEDESSRKIVGKIEEILNEGANERTIRYNVFIFPEETEEGRQPHNSKNEVYKTIEKEKEFYSNIASKCEVLSFEDYIKKRCTKNSKDVFFFRQMYLKEDETLIPELDPLCFCNKIFNPDKEYSVCIKCRKPYHIECLPKSDVKKCPQCGNPIENKNDPSKKSGVSLLNKKREREDNKNEEKFRNLPEDSRNNLLSMISNIDKISSMLSKTLNENQKVRMNARDKINYGLLYGMEELKNKDQQFWTDVNLKEKSFTEKKFVNPIPLSKNNINDVNFIKKFCLNLSIEIENFIFFQNRENVSSGYKKKLYTLYTNLIDERNTELRVAILLSEIPPVKLVEMSSEELAPSSVKKRRLEQQNKYFKEQVLMEDDSKIIAKSHKGDALLSVEPKDKNTEGYIPFETIEEKEEKKEPQESSNHNQLLQHNKQEPPEGEKKDKAMKNNNDDDIEEKELKKSEMKYKNLSSDKLKFYFDLEEYKKDQMMLKMKDRIKGTLKTETIDAINKLRKDITEKKENTEEANNK